MTEQLECKSFEELGLKAQVFSVIANEKWIYNLKSLFKDENKHDNDTSKDQEAPGTS